jgi:hypothetical protein
MDAAPFHFQGNDISWKIPFPAIIIFEISGALFKYYIAIGAWKWKKCQNKSKQLREIDLFFAGNFSTSTE